MYLPRLKIGKESVLTYDSAGQRTDKHGCVTKPFIRNGVHYDSSFEERELLFLLSRYNAHTETSKSLDGDDKEDFVLPLNYLRLPAEWKSAELPGLGRLVWDYRPPGCGQDNATKAYQQLFRGPAALRLKANSTRDAYLDALVTTKAPLNGSGPVLGLVLTTPRTICRISCYATTVEGIFFTFLRRSDLGINTNITAFDPDSEHLQLAHMSHMYLKRDAEVTEQFFRQTCANEKVQLRQQLALIRTTESDSSITPLFGPGVTVLKSGSVAHLLKCAPEQVKIDQTISNCTDEIPIRRLDDRQRPMDTMYYMDPITMIIKDFSIPVVCSPTFPQVYRLDGNKWACNDGEYIHACQQPTLLQPVTNEISYL